MSDKMTKDELLVRLKKAEAIITGVENILNGYSSESTKVSIVLDSIKKYKTGRKY